MKKKCNKVIFLVVYLAYVSIYVARINLSMAGPELISGNILSTVELGMLGSVFSAIYAAGRLVNGGIGDKTPPWIMLTTGLIVAGASNIFISFFPPFIGIFVLWTSNAYAQSMLWSSVLCVITSIYDKNTAKKKTSLMVTSVATGNILAIIINTYLIETFGVNFAFIVPGILTVVLGALVFLTTKNITAEKSEEKKHLSLIKLIKDKELSLMSIPAFFHGVMKENISLWMAVYIVDTYFVDLTTSAYYILFIPVIGFVGRTLYPAFYKLLKERENVVSLAGFGACILCSLPLCMGVSNMIISILCLSLIYAAVSVINTSMLSIYPLRYMKTGNVSSVSGMMDFATYLGGGIASMIYGVVIKNWGYTPMFLSWTVISGISIILLYKIGENKM